MIEINNLTTVLLDEGFFKKVIAAVLKGEGVQEPVELSLAFIGPGRMRKLNKRYRGKNRVTDVLSFNAGKNSPALGEIVICLREVNKNAKRVNSS